MNAKTGADLDGIEHLRQSVLDILMTPIGSLPMMREYGSLLPELIDHPFNAPNRVRLYGATAQALHRWEPRLRLRRVSITPGAERGGVVVTAEGDRLDIPGRAESVRMTLQIHLS
jgi:phage baseplate assembly protein W